MEIDNKECVSNYSLKNSFRVFNLTKTNFSSKY